MIATSNPFYMSDKKTRPPDIPITCLSNSRNHDHDCVISYLKTQYDTGKMKLISSTPVTAASTLLNFLFLNEKHPD